MKEIPLTQGKVAIVDDDMYEYLSQWKWWAAFSRGQWYARRLSDDGQTILMHRVIVQVSDDLEVDHRDGDGLHNWRGNLRACSHLQNAHNRKIRSDNSTGYKGVQPRWDSHRYAARITFDGRRRHLGTFDTAEEAARAYDAKARELFGPFARTNFDN